MPDVPVLPGKPLRRSLLGRAIWHSLLLSLFLVAMLSLGSFLVMRRLLVDVLIGIKDRVPEFSWDKASSVLDAYGLTDGNVIASALMTIGVLMLVCSVLLAILLARSLAGPIVNLTDKVRALVPSKWNFHPTIRTGDEVEMLDRTVADLTDRLRTVYEHLEDEVADRTRKLQVQYALDRAILDTMAQGVVTVDREGKIQSVNPAAVEMLRLAEENPLGKNVATVLPLRAHRESVKAYDHPVLRCLRTRKPYRSPHGQHISVCRSDSTFLPVILACSPLIVGNRLTGAVLVIEDITEERQIDYMKSEFITLASHQLRTPLSSLRWYTELLKDDQDSLNKEQKNSVREIRDAADRMVNLLNALLNAARLEDSGLEPEYKPVDARSLVTDAAHDSEERAKQLGIHVRTHTPPSAVDCTTDPTLVAIILQNLIGNALKYSPNGSTVDVTLHKKGSSIAIDVGDAGMGIPADQQERVFQKFFRGSNVRRTDTDGSGLGLYISKSIAERLGGTLSFKSAENKGTTFTLLLPVSAKTTKNRA